MVNPNIKSHTGRFGNTWYWTGVGGQKDGRSGGLGALAVDFGSDGKLNAGVIGGFGQGPKGTVAGLVGTGKEGWFGKGWGMETNGKLQEFWSKFLPYKSR
jgi:hypothetical protein